MKYYFIAGEASGDLHASHLVAALRAIDPRATFRGYGGELMERAGTQLVCHYSEMAYMGFIPVLLHARTILRRMAECKRDIEQWQPHVVVLVDYPGFNLRIAAHVKRHLGIPVYYYIAPKIWAWKEHRIHQIRRDVDQLLSILPFERAFFEQKHGYPIHYVGNPTVDEVDAYCQAHPACLKAFCAQHGLDTRPIIALLAGSRRQEISANLRMMAAEAQRWAPQYQAVVAAAPGIPLEFYRQCLAGHQVALLAGHTFGLLQHSTAAMVTSGTATLETALFGVPQVVCYHMRGGRLTLWAKRLLLKVPYISLVNLVAGHQVVPELVASDMNPRLLHQHLAHIMPGGQGRQAQLQGYARMAQALGKPGAPQRAAQLMVKLLKKNNS